MHDICLQYFHLYYVKIAIRLPQAKKTFALNYGVNTATGSTYLSLWGYETRGQATSIYFPFSLHYGNTRLTKISRCLIVKWVLDSLGVFKIQISKQIQKFGFQQSKATTRISVQLCQTNILDSQWNSMQL